MFPCMDPAQEGLSAEQMQALHDAQETRRRIDRVAAVATISGWSIGVFAGLTLIGGIFSIPALVLGLGMVVVARNELRGARSIRALDIAAPRRLGWNQIVFGIMLVVYAVVQMTRALAGPSRYAAYANQGGEIAEMMGSIESLEKLLAVVVYMGVVIIGGASTGLTALYYFTRRSHIERFLRQTPPWVVTTIRAVA